MSAWTIECLNSECGCVTYPENIADLMGRHLDDQGWFVCEECGSRGHIRKPLTTAEGADTWYLKAIIRPTGYEERMYQPFAFLVGDETEDQPLDVWFRYYYDKQKQGSPPYISPFGPVLKSTDVLKLLVQMVRKGCLETEQVIEEMRKA